MSDEGRGAADLELTPKAEGVLLRVAARPGAGRSQVLGVHAGALKVALGAPPEKGKANKELLAFLAKAFGLRKAQLELTAGHTSRDKTVRIGGLAAPTLRARLAELLDPPGGR